MLWSVLCHCEDCRRASSSDYVSWFGVHRQTVQWLGPRKTYKSSEIVERSFCQNCGTPLSFETEVFPDETHLYAATLLDPKIYQPTAHIYWSERLPWVQNESMLPTYEKGFQESAQFGQDFLKSSSKFR